MPDPTLLVALGVDPNMGAAAGIALALSKLVFYPLVQLRRRKLDDGDNAEASGRLYVPERLHGGTVLFANALAAGGLAAALGLPIVPAISAASTGLIMARVAHEAMRKPTPVPALAPAPPETP